MKVILHSDEVNLLIYRYLQESGFLHTAFTFGAEANLGRPVTLTGSSTSLPSSGTVGGSVLQQLGPRLPPNCLISMLHKALLYCWIEHHTDPDTGLEIMCDQPFGFFNRHCCRVEQKSSEDDAEGGDSGKDDGDAHEGSTGKPQPSTAPSAPASSASGPDDHLRPTPSVTVGVTPADDTSSSVPATSNEAGTPQTCSPLWEADTSTCSVDGSDKRFTKPRFSRNDQTAISLKLTEKVLPQRVPEEFGSFDPPRITAQATPALWMSPAPGSPAPTGVKDSVEDAKSLPVSLSERTTLSSPTTSYNSDAAISAAAPAIKRRTGSLDRNHSDDNVSSVTPMTVRPTVEKRQRLTPASRDPSRNDGHSRKYCFQASRECLQISSVAPSQIYADQLHEVPLTPATVSYPLKEDKQHLLAATHPKPSTMKKESRAITPLSPSFSSSSSTRDSLTDAALDPLDDVPFHTSPPGSPKSASQVNKLPQAEPQNVLQSV